MKSEIIAGGVIVVLSLIFTAINPAFLSEANVQAMLRGAAYIGIPAVGMALSLISGLIDISVGSLIGLVSCLTAFMIIVAGVPWPVALLVAVLLGAVSSGTVGMAIVKLKLNPFITTISMSFVLRGLAYAVSQGGTIYPLPVKLAEIGNQRPFDLSWAFMLFVVLVIVGEFLLRGTIWGLTVRATGSDREVAKCTEVDPDKVNMQTFVLLGVLSAITGILITLRVNGGSVSAGLGMEFRAIVACAIGGVSLFGYSGSVVGAALGVLLSQVIANGLVAIGMPSEYQDVALGLLLVGVIALDVVKANIKLPIREKE